MTTTIRGISVNNRDGSENLDGVRELTVEYKVESNDKRDGVLTALATAGIPNIGDIYQAGNESDAGMVVVNKQAAPVDNCPFEWTVTVTCSNDIEDDPVGFVYQDNPLAKPAEISYGFQTRRILIPGQYNNPVGPPSSHDWEQGIFAPNGELFDPQPEAEIDEPILTIKKNKSVAEVSGQDFMSLNNCVNADPFQNAEVRQLRLKIPQAIRQWHKSVGYYFEVTYTMAYRYETWDIQLLNQGTYYFAGGKPAATWSTTQNRLTKKDDAGNPLIVNLTTNGDINTTATPTFTRIRFFREINFGSLGLN